MLRNNKIKSTKNFLKKALVFFCVIIFSKSWGQIYLHDFGTTTISTSPYTVAPTTINSNLSNSQWASSTGAFTNFVGNGGAPSQALSLSNSSGTPSLTLTFSVAAGCTLDITSFNFWRQRSTSGAQNWTLTINGIFVGSGTVPTTGASIGNTAVANSVNGLTGNVTVVLSLSGASGTGTFRLDDFTLNGSTSCGGGCTPPTVTITPTTQTICAGAITTISVSSSATSPSYTWQASANGTSGWANVVNGTPSGAAYSGINSAVLTVTAGTTYYYQCLVAEGGTCTATTPTAQVIVNTAPSITSQPISVTTNSTGTAAYSVTVSGSGLSYQWQENSGSGFSNVSNGGTNPTYAGVTSSVLTISNPPLSMSGYSYQCVVSNACGTLTTNGSATLTVTTALTCPYLVSAVINSCDGCASEGNNEFLVLNTGSYSFAVNSSNVNITYSNGPTNITSSFAAQPASLATLNTATINACGTTFVDVSNGATTVPANSTLLIINKGACFTGDWSAYCGLGTVYVAFSSTAAWATTGFFGNNNTARTFVTNFSNVNSSCGSTTYAYNQSGIAGTPFSFGTDGASVLFNGASPPTYINGNGNCAPPSIILPIDLIDFYATQDGDKNILIWKVASEKNVVQYIIEKSDDGINFKELTRVNSLDNEITYTSYSCEDYFPIQDITYYRLSTIEKNQKWYYHKTIDIDRNDKKWKAILYQISNNLILEFKKTVPKDAQIALFDLSGKLVAEEIVKDYQTKINVETISSGIYFARITTPYKTENFKIIIQND